MIIAMRVKNHKGKFCMKHLLSPVLFSALLIHSLVGIAAENVKQAALPLEDLQRFTSVVEQIQNYYVQPTTDKALFENAIRGMLAGLDPHSAYLDPEEYAELRANTSGKFG